MNDKYEMGGKKSDIIGSGSYGTVLKGVRRGDQKAVAIKRSAYCPVQGCPPSALRECSSLRKLRGRKNIVQLLDFYMEHSFVTLIMPLYHTDLFSLIGQYPDGMPRSLTKHLAQQILSGLISCHESGIMHRDLKPSNILVTGADCSLAIADFGLARFSFLRDMKLTREVVTVNYRPPELLLGNDPDYEQPYAHAVDIWAFGCILFEIRTGKILFSGNKMMEQVELLHSIDEESPLRNLSSTKRLHEVVTCMLAIDPTDRPSTFTLMGARYFSED